MDVWAQLVKILAQLVDVSTQSIDVLAQLLKGIHGEQHGISIVNLGGLWMQNIQRMRSEAFIHNDDVRCFHVVIKKTQKMVMMGHHNFEDKVIIKRQWVGQKMNGTSGKLKDENKWSNCRKLFSFATDKLCAFLKVWNSHKHECGERN